LPYLLSPHATFAFYAVAWFRMASKAGKKKGELIAIEVGGR